MTTSVSAGMRSLVAGLSAAGAPLAAYRHAFTTVDRAHFIPDRIWVGGDEDRDDTAVDRGIDPQAWDKAVYDATLLSEIVGSDEQVTTVEIDPDVAAQATARLDASGYLHNVRVIVGDGATTTPADRPWDRVIATAAVPLGRVPYGWVEHTRPGGVIVAPLFADLTSDPLVRLVVSDEGTARGHVDAELRAGFMHLRAQRTARTALGALAWDDESADLLHTSVDIWDPLHHPAWCWALAVAIPSCRYNTYPPGERSPRRLILFQDPLSGSWASIHGADDDGRLTVRQSGPRRLADEALAAIRWFARRGA
ncbi:MAG: protein-L-isoaspartate O-methyltransferase family protein, partial [Pseudonocardiaceae bacterium]